MKLNLSRYRNYAAAVLLAVSVPLSRAQVVQTFSFTGSIQSFTVPQCVATITVDLYGSQGGINTNSIAGGMGGRAYGVMTVTAGDVLNIYVGGTNGYNGGGAAGLSACTAAMGGVGGGATDVRLNGNALGDRVIVAAGGGGAGGDRINGCGRGTGGGGGGGYYGGGGGAGYPQNSTTVPTGGSQTAGGNGGISTYSSGQNGMNGGLGFGGAGGSETSTNQAGNNSAMPGGHGGGLVGNSGQQPGSNIFTGQSGAGGSSYLGNLSAASTTIGARSGNGLATLSYNFQGVLANVAATPTAICSGNNATLAAGGGQVSYTWSPGGANSQSIVVSPGSTTAYTLNATNSLNCVSTAVYTLNVSAAAPVLSVSSSTNQTCYGRTVTVNATGALSYSWTNGVSSNVPFTPSVTANYVVTGVNGCGQSSAAVTITVSPLPVPIAASQTVLCQNNPATLTASGGTSYTWMPSNQTFSSIIIAPSVSTVYTVTASDGTCAGFNTVSISVNPNPTITVAGTATQVCAGESVTITASGAATYTWNQPGGIGAQLVATPTTATLYQVSGTNSFSCTTLANHVVVVDQPPPLSGNLTSTINCENAPTFLSGSGAANYTWSTGAPGNTLIVSPSVSTVYTLYGSYSTNSCIAVWHYSVNTASTELEVSTSTTICEGGTVTFTAGGTGHQWSHGGGAFSSAMYTPSVTTIYTVTAVVNPTLSLTCPASGTIQATVYPNPTVLVSAERTVICRFDPLVISATGAQSYSWSPSGTGASITFTSSSSTTHNISVTGTDQNGCSAPASMLVRVQTCSGLNDVSDIHNFHIYPNPSAGTIFITSGKPVTLNLYDATGRVIATLNVSDARTELNGLAPGIYFIGREDAGLQNARKIVVGM